MGVSPSKSHGPKQELSLACGQCGKPALVFESFVSSGPVHELVSHQVSEMCAFLSNAPDGVRCQSCAMKARDALERENRYLAQETARNNELARQASVRSQRSGVYGVSGGNGTLRRTRSARSLMGRLRDSFFEREDYVTDNEEEETGGGVRTRGSQRRSVRFASQESIQPDMPLNYVPAQEMTYQEPPPQPARQPINQAPYQPEERTRDINAGPSVGGPPNLHLQTNNLPPIPMTGIPEPGFPRNFSPPPNAQQPPPPNPSYSGPGPTFANPPPGPQRDMAYQSPPTANPMYAPTGMLPQGNLDMPDSPVERLRRENTQRRAELEAAERYRLDQETRYAETSRLERENRQLERQREKAAREGRRREEMMNGPPPRDAEPIFGGSRPPKRTKSRGEGYGLGERRDLTRRNSGQPGTLVQLLLLGKKVYDEWEKQ
jgi:hypothetical protein